MKQYKKITAIMVFLLTGALLCAAPAFAVADKTLIVGNGSGNYNDIVSLPITLNDPTGVGGAAFTMTYDTDVFEFMGLEQVTAPPISDGSAFKVPEGSVIDDKEYYNPYIKEDPYVSVQYDPIVPDTGPYSSQNPPAPALFYQFNDKTDDQNELIGKVLVAAASATALDSGTLFNARFKIKGGQGKYPIGLSRTIIHNPAAGYNTPQFIPALVGMPASEANSEGYYETPVFSALLVSGSITVNADGHTISGAVTYGDNSPAVGCPVVLKKETALGGYVLKDKTTVAADGSYSFTGKVNGNYRVCVTSFDRNFYDNKIDVTVNNADVSDADVVLPAPTIISGTVTINGGHIPGLKVKIINAAGIVVGIYSVNSDNTYTIGHLPPGTYKIYAFYGSLTSPELSELSDAYNWGIILHTISGTVSGLAENDIATVTAGSVIGKLMKTVQSAPADASGVAAYAIPYLVPAADYIVSAVAEGKPVIYYDGKSDISKADKVDISSADRNDVNLNWGGNTQGTISGSVIENGSDVAGIAVYAFNVDSSSLTYALTDNSGDYLFILAPGDYEVFVIKGFGKVFYYADGGSTQSQENATILEVTEDGVLIEKNIDITECEKTLAGKVTYERLDGDPVVNTLITAIGADGSAAMDVTAADGSYTLSGLCDGTEYTVRMDPPGAGFAVQTEVITGGDDTTLNFIIDTGNELSGRITEAGTTDGVAKAMIYLIDEATGILAGRRLYFSDSQGNYSISDIPDGIYTLMVSHPLYRAYTENDLAIMEDTIKDVQLAKGAHFYGTVIDGDNGNAPLPGVLIIVASTTSGNPPVYRITNSAGQYKVYGLDASSSYIIMAQKRGYERQVITAQPAEGAGTEVNFTLIHPAQTFNLNGAVTSDCDGSAVDAHVMVSSNSKKFFARTRTDVNGDYSLTNLPQADDYRFMVIPKGSLQPYVESGLDFSAVTGDVVKDVVLPCGSEISGTVTWSGGGTAYVFLYTGENKFVDFTTVDTSGGTYTFTGLADGDYKVLAVAGGNTPEWYNDQATMAGADLVAAGSSDVHIDLTN